MKFAKRMERMQSSEIRELLKLTAQPDIISFAGGLPAPELFPVKEIAKVSHDLVEKEGQQLLQYATTEGRPTLRAKIAARMKDKYHTEVDPDDPDWVEKVAEITGAVSGDTYVKLDHGILTVNQIDMFLKAMPFELTYADDNNQFLYYNNAHQDPDTMFAKRVPPQSGSRMSTVHGSLPPARMKNVEWVIGTLRNGNQEYVRTIVPGSPEGVINTHNYQAMYYDDGSYAGINEIVFNFKPWLDWYLETTGQRLVGGSGPFAPAAASHGGSDATSGASDAGGHGDASSAADATSGASSY